MSISAGCSKSLFGKAAASEVAKRKLSHPPTPSCQSSSFPGRTLSLQAKRERSRKAFSTAWFVIDAIRTFKYRQRTMAAVSRARQLQRLVGRIERLITGGTALSSRFTTYRLAIFIAGVICTVTLFRSGHYQSGNLALAGIVIVFLIVASYHNRLEQRIHRLRVWMAIKSAHLARVQLAWSQIPYKPAEPFATHLYA